MTRAIQKCGFDGMSDLRYQILNQKNLRLNENRAYNVNSIIQKTYSECINTIENIVLTDVLKVIELIRTSKNVYVAGIGSTSLVAEEFTKYLQILGIQAILTNDSTWIESINKIASSSDLLVILSVNGKHNLLIRAAHIAKNSNIPVVSCCCNKKSKLKEYSDIVIYGHTENINEYKGIRNDSRLPLLIITRIITEYLEPK